MRGTARNWLELGEKVYHYRRDELKDADRAALQQQMESLRALLKSRADASKLKLGIESLEGVLRRIGGKIYPKSTLQEYVEFFLVAAIVVLGIRTYFIQPFKIPTNSMWPSYNGLTAKVYANPDDAPGVVGKAFRFVTRGAVHHEVVAPESGTIQVPVSPYSGRIHYNTVKGRKWGVIPAPLREYVFRVNNRPVTVRVPADFDFDAAAPLPSVGAEGLGLTLDQFRERAHRPGTERPHPDVAWVTLDKQAERGKAFLSFDVLVGDLLFVDRVSYHFFEPKVGQGFVFRTKNIPDMPGQPDQYYIKRLVGVPGDKIEVREPVLFRNGKPIAGSEAFERNARRQGNYRGYLAQGRLAPGRVDEVPADRFLALGDNSANSSDGRVWGYVPEKDVVGRPIVVYFPFYPHWGIAR